MTNPKKKTGPKGPSKPMTDADFKKVIGMMEVQCTQDEICNIMNMNADTLGTRLKDRGYANFSDCYKRHSDKGKQSLRRMQWKGAQAGNATMLIWLGKQILGQRDTKDIDLSSRDGTMSPGFDPSKLSKAARLEILEAYDTPADEE